GCIPSATARTEVLAETTNDCDVSEGANGTNGSRETMIAGKELSTRGIIICGTFSRDGSPLKSGCDDRAASGAKSIEPTQNVAEHRKRTRRCLSVIVIEE